MVSKLVLGVSKFYFAESTIYLKGELSFSDFTKNH